MKKKSKKKKVDPKTQALLNRIGYTKLKEEGVKPQGPEFPNLKDRFNGTGHRSI